MMARVRQALIVLALLTVAFGLITWWALEGRDVAILYTVGPDGSHRRTRVWVAEADGALWLEAATSDRPFYRDIQQRSAMVQVEHRGRRARATATLVPEPGGHARIRRLLAEKYGWADAWIGLIQDTSRSVAVRLSPPP